MSESLATPTARLGEGHGAWKNRRSRVVLRQRLLADLPRAALLVLVGAAIVRAGQVFPRGMGDAWSGIWVSLPLVALICLAGAALLVTAEAIHRTWRLPTEYSRKLAHVGAGGIAFFALPHFSTHWPVLLLALIFSGTLLASRCLGLFASLGLRGRRQGDLLFLWAVYLVFLLADGDWLLFWAPVLVLTIGDAAAALIGQSYGRIRYAFLGNHRTVEGSVALVVASVISVFGLLFSLADLPLVQCALLSLLAATVAGAAEAISPQGWDNVGIPLATLFLLEGFLS